MTERRRWFLPEVPDVHGLLRAQVAITREGVEAFEGWCRGESDAADRVGDAEGRGDVAKRAVLTALRGAFVTELEPEDLFSLPGDRPDPELHEGPGERGRAPRRRGGRRGH